MMIFLVDEGMYGRRMKVCGHSLVIGVVCHLELPILGAAVHNLFRPTIQIIAIIITAVSTAAAWRGHSVRVLFSEYYRGVSTSQTAMMNRTVLCAVRARPWRSPLLWVVRCGWLLALWACCAHWLLKFHLLELHVDHLLLLGGHIGEWAWGFAGVKILSTLDHLSLIKLLILGRGTFGARIDLGNGCRCLAAFVRILE